MIERMTNTGQIEPWHGEMPVEHRYTMGVAGERFFRQIKDKAIIMASRCGPCNLTYVPPKMYCPRCFQGLEDWVEIGVRGKVYTFTIAYFDMDGARLSEPEIVAVIKYDGVEGGLIHRLGEVGDASIRVGTPVEAVFKEPSERKGNILDIKYFRPISV